jgi:folate-dependent tRNA-U54 methylase TrmFO/GidA
MKMAEEKKGVVRNKRKHISKRDKRDRQPMTASYYVHASLDIKSGEKKENMKKLQQDQSNPSLFSSPLTNLPRIRRHGK